MASVMPIVSPHDHLLSPTNGKFPRLSGRCSDQCNWKGGTEEPTDERHGLSDDSRTWPDWPIVDNARHSGNVPVDGITVSQKDDKSSLATPKMTAKDSPRQTQHREPERFRLALSLSDAEADEVRVQVNGNILTVSGRVIDEVDQDGVHTLKSKKFTHRFRLSENVDVDGLESEFRDDGTLVLEAPLLGQESSKTR